MHRPTNHGSVAVITSFYKLSPNRVRYDPEADEKERAMMMDLMVVAWARRALITLAVLATAAGLVTSPAAAQDSDEGLVRVVHGLRGLVADVYLDGTLVLPTFRPERSTDPLPIPAGDHLIEIREAGAATTDEPLLTQEVTVPAGFRGSLIAHLDREGEPTLTAFADDLTPLPPGQSRVVIRHAAAAGPVRVLLNDEPTFERLRSATEAAQVVGAGRYEVAVTAPQGGEPLAPPQGLEYADGTAYFMYLIGSRPEGTLGWAAVQIGNLETAPAQIQTGDGSTRSSGDVSLVGPLAAAAGLAGCGVLWARARRARRLS
jgi:hypothetical protein